MCFNPHEQGEWSDLSVDLKNEGHWVAQSDGMGLKRVGLLRGKRGKILWQYHCRTKRTRALH